MQQLDHKILERGAAFFNTDEIKKRLDNQTREDIDNGKKEFFLADIYVRKKLDGFAGEIEIIRQVDDLQVGVTRFDKGKLPTGVYVAVLGVGAALGYDATDALEEDQVRYASSEYLNTFPTKVVNADLVVKNGENKILEARMKSFLANAYADFAVEANDENLVLLPTPKLMDYRKLTTANLKFPLNGAAPSHSHFVEIRFKGVMIGDRA